MTTKNPLGVSSNVQLLSQLARSVSIIANSIYKKKTRKEQKYMHND